ncbi:hypothetical protein HBI31_224510 [Parastagonospora nodorum]|nr:hypothetical protein HBI31_224510 [Parastagonospora nodorum]
MSILAFGEALSVADAEVDAEAGTETSDLTSSFASFPDSAFPSPSQSAKASVASSQTSPLGTSIFALSHVSGHSSFKSANAELCAAHQDEATLVYERNSATSELGTAVESAHQLSFATEGHAIDGLSSHSS